MKDLLLGKLLLKLTINLKSNPMKKKLSVLFVLLIAVVTFTHAQSKKEVEADLIKCTTAKDSIQNLLTGLSVSYDSINKVCIAYDTMYNAIKEKVFLDDFDPANMSELIDSLQTEAFSGTTVLNDSITVFNDSITVLQVENTELKAKIESMTAGTDGETEIVNSLKQLKDLLDANILTQEEFDAKKAVLIEKL